MPSKSRPDAPQRICPICGKPSVEKYAPFDSKRCADIDLHHWLTGRYAIPAEESDYTSEESDAGAAGPPPDSDEGNGTVH